MRSKRKIYITILIAISLIIIYGLLKKNNEEQKENIEGELEEGLESEVKFQGELTLKEGISLSFPTELYIFNNSPIELDKAVVNNLTENGWEDHEFINKGNGQYIIRCEKRGESYEISEEDFLMQAKKFIKDSGIEAALNDRNIEYEYSLQYIENSYIAFCYLLKEGERTGAYIRMEFQGEYICSECLINIYDVEILEKLPARDIKDALKDSFYMGEKGESNFNNYTVSEVVLVYYNGMPYYKFMAIGNDTRDIKEGYCLAVNS